MTTYCIYCKTDHDDFSWRHTDYTDQDGTKKTGWFCRKAFSKSTSKEWIPERIKNERKEYAKSMLQPFREGVASKEFIEAYPERAKTTFTPQDMVKAKYVWQNDVITKHWRNSK